MLKFGFDNLRRIRHVGPVEIRPITLLVGRNSSGKSTFLRTIPLFRQSISTKTSSPVLWYGDLVDFGSFDVSVASKHADDPIIFRFHLDRLYIRKRHDFYYRGTASGLDRLRMSNVSFDIHILPVERRTRISKISIVFGSSKTGVDLHFDEVGVVEKLLIDQAAVSFDLKEFNFTLSAGALFPDLYSYAKSEEDERRAGLVYLSLSESAFEKEAFRILRPSLDARIADKTLRSFIASLFSRPQLTREYLRTTANNLSSRFRSFVREIAADDPYKLFDKLSHLVLAAALPTIIEGISRHLRAIFGSSLYIGPARARSERYYRYQDLAVSEIDPDGKNFPMFLNSLDEAQIESLSNWIRALFGYGIRVQRSSGHISIELLEHDSTANVTDVGYGVSQILPVLGQIWWARARPRDITSISSSMTLLAIEQPELHLHPAHQALLADALVGETSIVAEEDRSNERVNFIIETHSETLVNRLGELIERGKIAKGDVQILIFEPSMDDDDVTTVRSVEYDENGVITGWPFGFFEPERF